ncbi:MAG: FAD-dependent oxidoreductase [Crocosphaera sp.]
MNNCETLNNNHQIYDILIVGAGPVGLAIAVGLKKRGIDNILILDQTREFRKVGQVVDLLPNGLKSIKYLDTLAYDKLKEASIDLMKYDDKNSNKKSQFWHFKNLEGEIIRSISLSFDDWFNNDNEGRFSINWYDLQTSLRKLLPQEMVKANNRCIGLEKRENYLEITCSSNGKSKPNLLGNWKMEKIVSNNEKIEEPTIDKVEKITKFKGKILIGADGINSIIRQEIYANTELEKWAKPEYSGWTAISCFSLENVPDSIVTAIEEKYLKGNKIVTIADNKLSDKINDLESRIIIINYQNNRMGFIFNGKFSLELIEKKSPELLMKSMLDILGKAQFPNSIYELVQLSSIDNLMYRPYYIHPTNISNNHQSVWTKDGIILVGDAAHGMPPFLAQGANQGFEDAAIVTTLIKNIIENNALDNPKIITEEFKKYEDIRRPFMSQIQAATLNNMQWSTEEWEQYQTTVYRRNIEQICQSVIN